MRAEAITEGAQAAPHNPLRERRPFAVPWGYAESLTLALAAMVGGFAAEWLTGPPPLRLIAWPLNLALALIVVALAALARFNRRRAAVKYFTSVPFSVALIAGLGALSLVMGFIPQAAVPYSPPAAPSLGARLGLDHLTSSWPFAVLYSATLLSLGATIAVRFSLKRLIFLANHLGLWLLLLAAGLGAADRLREFMPVREGGLEWRVQHPDGSIAELPLAIRLDSFDVEEYPAKLALIDHETGLPQGTDGRMDFFQLDPLEPKGRLLGYDIELLEYLPSAVPSQDLFVKAITQATVQAARISVVNRSTGQRYEGWISTGEQLMPPKPLRLEDKLMLAMTRPEPRRFVSQVKVFTQEGQEVESAIEVNKPLKAGSWLIYQRDYDTQAGRSSTWSGFELVRDPWLGLANAGLIVWAAGSLGLIAKGRKGR